jgi:hypothetical protein
MNSLDSIALPIFAAFVACILAGLILHGYLLSYLRRVHTPVWEQLGRPKLFHVATSLREIPQLFHGMLRDTFGTHRFLYFSNSHKDLNDVWLNALIWVVRILAILSIVFFLLTQFVNPQASR